VVKNEKGQTEILLLHTTSYLRGVV